MKYFAHYDLETGEVFSLNMSLSEDSFAGTQGTLELTEDGYAAARATKTGAYVANSTLVQKPPMPTHYHFWDKTNKVWVLDVERQTLGESENMRALRDQLLASSDWTDTLSFRSRMGDQVADAWATYRQSLRDIPNQPGFPLNVILPDTPEV